MPEYLRFYRTGLLVHVVVVHIPACSACLESTRASEKHRRECTRIPTVDVALITHSAKLTYTRASTESGERNDDTTDHSGGSVAGQVTEL